jgi:hypothetical protein
MYLSASHAAALSLMFCATTLLADDSVSTDKSQYTLFNPTPAAQMRTWRTDNAGETPFTIDAGHFEAGLTPLSYAYTEQNVRVYAPYGMPATLRSEFDEWAYGALTLKAGLLNSLEFETTILPYETCEIKTLGARSAFDTYSWHSQTFEGFGDMTSSVKWNAWGNDGGKTALSFSGFVKFPTAADGLGNDRYEGGPAIEFAAQLPLELQLIVNEAVDFYGDNQDHAQAYFGQSAGLQRHIVGKLDGFCMFTTSIGTEFDNDWVGSVQPGVAYRLFENVELFARSGFGVSGDAFDYQPSFGARARF